MVWKVMCDKGHMINLPIRKANWAYGWPNYWGWFDYLIDIDLID